MKVLAIESSCDETSASIVTDESSSIDRRILSNVINSQIQIHKKYGGVIPEFAARNHLQNISDVINEALYLSNTNLDSIDVVCATAGPGLIGGLLVGLTTAKSIAMMKRKSFMGINHLEGHLLTTRLCFNVEFPYLLLLTSGGNFLFVEVFGIGKYKIIGETLDDAAGESFDKVAKMLGLPYPGGPSIQNASMYGDKDRFPYTIPLQKREGCDISFSGIKTATRIHIENLGENITEQDKCDIAASFQNIVVRSILRQFSKALNIMNQDIKNIVISGGVASNITLRSEIKKMCEVKNLNFFAPPLNLCSDNAAMIGWTAIERIKSGYTFSDLNFSVKPKWSLDNI